MLEYLFTFIENNIILIFLCVLSLGIASAYSKNMKVVFLSILGIAASYFAMLCFYRLGYGSEFLYQWSSKYVIMICDFIGKYHILFFNCEILVRLFGIPTFCGLSNFMFHIETIILLILYLLYFKKFALPYIQIATFRKIKITLPNVMKCERNTNTIFEKQPIFILNSILRC